MPQVIQAKCPQCSNVLRIPGDWLAKPIRCKHCNRGFQMTAKAAPVAVLQAAHAEAITPPPPLAMPRSASNDPFGFDADDTPTPPPDIARKPRKKGSGVLVLVSLCFCLLAFGATAAGLLYFKPWAHDSRHAKSPGDDDGANKTGPAKKSGTKDRKKDNVISRPGADQFPRRALLIGVNSYLMFNPVLYGSPQGALDPKYPGSSTGVLRERLTRLPMQFPLNQVVELSDGIPPLDPEREKRLREMGLKNEAPRPHSTQKSVIETTIKDFVDTCRDQDRIMIVFVGHGAYLEDPEPEDGKKADDKKPTGKSYLVPIDGNLKKPESLITVKWVLNQLAQCKAQQKILVLDVFRFSPSRGSDIASPGEGEEGKMPEGFDKELEHPPAGVQVWTSCVKDQSSIELDGGSAFLQSLCHSLQGTGEMKGISQPLLPIPIEELEVAVNQRLKDLLTPEKRVQTSRLTGKSGGAIYNRDEPSAEVIALKPPTAAGGEAAGYAAIDNILSEIDMLPPPRQTQGVTAIRAANLPAFPAKKIDAYKADGYQNVNELYERYKKNKDGFTKEFPLRGAYFETVEALKASSKISIREVLPGPVDPKRKAAFLLEQENPGKAIFKLQQTLAAVKEADEKRDMETSKRWLANFDYAKARLQSRIMYLFEYNYTLGQIRADALPELAAGQSGWRIGVNSEKLNVTEKAAKDLFKSTKRLWKEIEDKNQGTPWELLAQRESMIRLGLVWRAKSD